MYVLRLELYGAAQNQPSYSASRSITFSWFRSENNGLDGITAHEFIMEYVGNAG